jgi:hypothetical protein
MPRISSFYGIAVYMYWNEADHLIAHFHTRIMLGTGPLLLANWDRARRSERLLQIQPLP